MRGVALRDLLVRDQDRAVEGQKQCQRAARAGQELNGVRDSAANDTPPARPGSLDR